MDVSTCRNLIENLLSSYVDGELDSKSAHSLELHMQVCPPCAAFLRTFLAAKSLARKELVANMPESCEDSLWEFLEQELGSDAAEACGRGSSAGAESPATRGYATEATRPHDDVSAGDCPCSRHAKTR